MTGFVNKIFEALESGKQVEIYHARAIGKRFMQDEYRRYLETENINCYQFTKEDISYMQLSQENETME